MDIQSIILQEATRVLSSESQSIHQAISRLDEQFAQAIQVIFESKGRLIITGIGKSAHVANKIVATLNSTGTPSVFMHASEAIHGDLGMIQPMDVVLCISKSGNGPEIKQVVPYLKRDGNIVIALTGDKNSFLAKNASFVIDAFVEKESCLLNLAPTDSTTVQLALGDAIAVSLMRLRDFKSDDFAKYHPGGALGKKLLLKVESILQTSDMPKVDLNASVKEVIHEISSKRLGATAVLKENKILGIITDGDIRRMLEKSSDISGIKAKDIMSWNPKSISSQDLLSEALQLMEKNEISQLIVVEKNNYRGILHIHDILKEGILS